VRAVSSPPAGPAPDGVAAILQLLISCERVDLVAADRAASVAWRRRWAGHQPSAGPAVLTSPRAIEENPLLAWLLQAPEWTRPLRSGDVASPAGPVPRLRMTAVRTGSEGGQLAIPLLVSPRGCRGRAGIAAGR
jgi:hypothetical protein